MIVDAHNDLLTELVFRSPEERPFTDHWRVQLEQAGVGLTVCAVYPPDELRADGGLRAALLQIAACHRAAAEHEGLFEAALVGRACIALNNQLLQRRLGAG